MNWSSLKPADKRDIERIHCGIPSRDLPTFDWRRVEGVWECHVILTRKAKRPTKRPIAQPIKARKMPDWQDAKGNTCPQWRIPASKEAYDQMVEQMAHATTHVWRQAGAGSVCDEVRVGEARARAALSSIGIEVPKP